jgi:phage gpG-like protein
MIEITGEVTGAEEVQARFEKAGPVVLERVRASVQRLGLELLRKVKEEKLTGQVLNVRSGRLRRSINEETTVSGEVIDSTVGTPVVYGRAWELGFQGTESVRAHMRLGHPVRAFSRDVKMKARPFLQPALAEMKSRILEQLELAMKGAV